MRKRPGTEGLGHSVHALLFILKVNEDLYPRGIVEVIVFFSLMVKNQKVSNLLSDTLISRKAFP